MSDISFELILGMSVRGLYDTHISRKVQQYLLQYILRNQSLPILRPAERGSHSFACRLFRNGGQLLRRLLLYWNFTFRVIRFSLFARKVPTWELGIQTRVHFLAVLSPQQLPMSSCTTLPNVILKLYCSVTHELLRYWGPKFAKDFQYWSSTSLCRGVSTWSFLLCRMSEARGEMCNCDFVLAG